MDLIQYMDQMLRQKVFTNVEQVDYVNQMEELCEKMYLYSPDRLIAESYEWIMKRNMELEKYDVADVWGKRFAEQYPDHLASYTMRMKLYFETNQKDQFFEVMDQLRASTVVVDNKTLELIRMIQR